MALPDERMSGGADAFGSMYKGPAKPKRRRHRRPARVSTFNKLIKELQVSGKSVHELGDEGAAEEEAQSSATSRSDSAGDVTSSTATSTSVEQPPTGMWASFTSLFKGISMLCRLACPPVPERIVRKVAFHPPPRGSGYVLQLDAHPERRLHTVSDAKDEPFSLVPIPMRGLTLADYECVTARITAHRVRTSSGSDIVLIRVRSFRAPSNEAVRNQVILMTQPNSSDLGHFIQPHCVSFAHVADALEMDVYAFDYSGFGYSSGFASEKNLYADTQAAFDHIRRTRHDKQIVLMGYSIGTAAAVDVAARNSNNSISGMILIAPFTSGLRLVVSRPSSDEACCFDPFTNSEKISRIDVPILIIHGTEDTMVPLAHSRALARRLRRPLEPFVVAGADHQTVFSCQPQTFRRMLEFLQSETLAPAAMAVPHPPTLMPFPFVSEQPTSVSAQTVLPTRARSLPLASKQEVYERPSAETGPIERDVNVNSGTTTEMCGLKVPATPVLTLSPTPKTGVAATPEIKTAQELPRSVLDEPKPMELRVQPSAILVAPRRTPEELRSEREPTLVEAAAE